MPKLSRISNFPITLVAALMIVALPVSADAQARGGGSGRGGGGGQAGPGRGAPAPPPGGQGRGGPIYGPGPGRPYGSVHIGVGVGYGYPYYPWLGFGYGYPFYPYAWGWWGYPYRYAYPYPYPYPGYVYWDEFTAQLRLEIQPKDAEVYVDGYLAGHVDDFDGMFQRLRLRPGERDLVLYLDGYRTVQQHLMLASNSDQRIQYQMERLAPGESSGPRPTPPPEPVQAPPPQQLPQRYPPPQDPNVPPPTQEPQHFGVLSIRVQPSDAEILIDGERWDSPEGQRLVVQLSAGRHHVEASKPGFTTYSEDVMIRAGATFTLNISLLKGLGQ